MFRTDVVVVQGMNRTRIARIVETLKSPDFWTAVPVPTVAVSTPDFSTDLDRGPVPAQPLSRARLTTNIAC